MKRFAFIVTIILVALLLSLWSPWRTWDISFLYLFGIEEREAISGLSVTSLAGEVTVYIDGEQMATIDGGDTSVIPGIEPGARVVRIVRTADQPNVYWEFNRVLQFTAGVDVIISYELGPSERFSAGHVIYAAESNTAQQTNAIPLFIDTNNPEAAIEVNGLSAATGTLQSYQLDLSKQSEVSVSAVGYEEQKFTLLPFEQEDRDDLRGYELFVDVQLFLEPI